MPINQVLLLTKIDGLGAEGEEVSVKPGYARNYLFPKKLAIPLTRANRKQVEALQERRKAREAVELNEAKELAEKINSLNIGIAVKTGETGKMFGAVTAADLYAKIEEAGIEVDRKKIQLPSPVNQLGKHTTEVKLHPEVIATLRFEVVSENPIPEVAVEAESEA